VIKYAFYGAASAFIGLLITGTLIGKANMVPLAIVTICITLGSALWAQLVEGSSGLMRPFGWYGGVLGVLVGVSISMLLGANPWLLLGAFSVAAPWIQSAGRLRCLLQGCCHGRVASDKIGIRYSQPQSRVCKLSSLSGAPVHATPLYSIGHNLVLAIVMARIWLLRLDISLILGVYLILSGLGRFVEESYRGEPQTPMFAGMRLYQWIAVLSVIAGISVTMFKNTPNAPRPEFSWATIIVSALFGIVALIALGVDFPESNRRFARLA